MSHKCQSCMDVLSPLRARCAQLTNKLIQKNLLPGSSTTTLLPLFLHFDLNRTIVQIDPAGGKTLSDVLNSNLASKHLGIVTMPTNTNVAIDEEQHTQSGVDAADSLLLATLQAPSTVETGQDSSPFLLPFVPLPSSHKNHQEGYCSACGPLHLNNRPLWTALPTHLQPATMEETHPFRDHYNQQLTPLLDRSFSFTGKPTLPPYRIVGVMPYDEYVDDILHPNPQEEMKRLRGTEGDKAAAQLWNQVTSHRRWHKLQFASMEGQPGHQLFSKHWEALYRNMLRNPSSFSSATSSVQAESLDENVYWFVLPSFFHACEALKSAQWPNWTMCFRTFGSELDEVLHEWEQYLAGKGHHTNGQETDLPRAQLSSDPRDWLHWGTLQRNKEGVFVCWEQSKDRQATAAAKEKSKSFVQVAAEDFVKDLHRKGSSTSSSSGSVPTIALQDYYPWWATNSESATAGKFFPVPFPSMSSAQSICTPVELVKGGTAEGEHHQSSELEKEEPLPLSLQVFFDDNIRIGDTRSIVNLELVPWPSGGPSTNESSTVPVAPNAEIQCQYLVQVDPNEAILDHCYFTKAFANRISKQLTHLESFLRWHDSKL